MRQLERMKEDGTYLSITKKEVSRLEKERERFEKYLGGLKNMGSLPAAVFVIDPAMETIAVSEANKIGIPVIAITDTNCDPDQVDFVIPGNDDAIRSIKLITPRIADAVVEGSQRRKEFVGRDDEGGGGGRGDGPAGRGHPRRAVVRGRRARGGRRARPRLSPPTDPRDVAASTTRKEHESWLTSLHRWSRSSASARRRA